MKTNIILENIDVAISNLLVREIDILKRGLTELNISTHLAIYLKSIFTQHDVDPEYNGDIDKPNDKKALDIARNRIREIKKAPNTYNNYRFIPDIIIHKRGTNENNLVVIEVKKDIHSKRLKDFDLIKLEHLTIDYLDNHYNYKIGVE